MTKKELEKIIDKLINDKVPNDVVMILKNIRDIANDKLLDISFRYYKCDQCGKISLKRRWKSGYCPICGKF